MWKGKADRVSVSEWTESLSLYLSKHCPVTFEETINFNYRKALSEIFPSSDFTLTYRLDWLIKEFVDIYRPPLQYTVSFSKINNDTLLWSHYASKHRGYCLVFRSIDGCLLQDKNMIVKSIHRKTPNSILAQSSSSTFPDRFKFCDIDYCTDIEMIDAARFMPYHVFGRDVVDEKERIKFVTENDAKCLEKHICWNYEQESRIILNSPTPWIFGNHFDLIQEERLFYYQPKQLVGVIFGALMAKSDKERIQEIISLNIERNSRNCAGCAVFDFVFSQANISDKSRDLEIVPERINKFVRQPLQRSSEIYVKI